jgi:hypothetical protein
MMMWTSAGSTDCYYRHHSAGTFRSISAAVKQISQRGIGASQQTPSTSAPAAGSAAIPAVVAAAAALTPMPLPGFVLGVPGQRPATPQGAPTASGLRSAPGPGQVAGPVSLPRQAQPGPAPASAGLNVIPNIARLWSSLGSAPAGAVTKTRSLRDLALQGTPSAAAAQLPARSLTLAAPAPIKDLPVPVQAAPPSDKPASNAQQPTTAASGSQSLKSEGDDRPGSPDEPSHKETQNQQPRSGVLRETEQPAATAAAKDTRPEAPRADGPAAAARLRRKAAAAAAAAARAEGQVEQHGGTETAAPAQRATDRCPPCRLLLSFALSYQCSGRVIIIFTARAVIVRFSPTSLLRKMT